MFFPVAGIEVNPLIPPVVAFFISFIASMGGISGAFLLLPFQMSFLGYVHPSVSATNQVFNIVAIPSGVYRYWREGRLIWPLVWVVVLGTLPGVFIGSFVRIQYLPDSTYFKLFVATVLLYIGVKMLLELRRKSSDDNIQDKILQEKLKNAKKCSTKSSDEEAISELLSLNSHTLSFRFYDLIYSAPLWGIFSLSFIVGIIGGIYGIGGGSIIAPFFVTFFKLPVYIVAGAALFGTFITSIAGVAFFQIIAPYYPELSVAPDWMLGLLFGVGGTLGMYLGARCQKFVSSTVIKYILVACMFLTAGKYVLDFLNA